MAEAQENGAPSAPDGVPQQQELFPHPGGQLYRILADTMPLPVIVVDLDGIVLHANERAATIFEMPWEEAVGQYMPDFYVDPQARAAYMERLQQHGRIVDYEVQLEAATGRHFWALISASVTILEGRPAVFTAINDITERRRMEQELRSRAEELEQANREAQEARRAAEEANHAKSAFLANMNHELRTPLNAILGFSDLLAQDPALTSEQRANIRTIHRSGELLLQLINDVLDMARLETGRTEVQNLEMDLHYLLAGLTETFRLRAAEKGLTLAVEHPPDLPRYIVSDERKVRQILLNLLSNAIQFTASGGVSLRVRVEEDRAAHPPGFTLVCTAQDTGPGIPPEYQEAVFQPFVQTGRQDQSHAGTGLGLPISRSYARRLGGDLTLVSTGAPGAGALLELRIPVALEAAESTAVRPRAAGQEAERSRYRLLVAEDQPDNRLLLEIMLRRWGFEVRTAQDGPEALQLWEKWQPHLIWMDLYMPGLDGYEVARRIKATQQGRPTIIVALSASVREEDEARSLAAGCDDFLRKPFHQADLVGMLTRHLGVRIPSPDSPAEDNLHVLAPAAAHPAPRGPLDISGLPAGWIAQVHQAAITADGSRIAALAEEVRGEQPAVAARLHMLVEEFDYQTILNATQEAGRG